MTSPNPAGRLRREPPAFRRVSVQAVASLTPRLVRVSLAGPELKGLVIDQPAASVRLLLPPAGGHEPVIPTWTGNEFLLPDGSRPPLRTLTPLRADPEAGSLDVEIVVHGGGALTAWVAGAEPGDEVALSGPGRGYPVDPGATAFLVAGDESAIPAIGQVLEALPEGSTARVLIEAAHPDARLDLPAAPPDVRWLDLPPGAPPGDALVPAVAGSSAGLPAGVRIWAAGEAAAMQRIRRHILDERGIPRSATWIRGYWKNGRAGDTPDD
ncbi:MAG TPA: siderophore-interacting protein [Acidimicrobiia bacterium]|nr:siderophore-interacting protein [Acidimicrobiia bacterium]